MKSIAIIGAGPAGLSLGRLLHLQTTIEFTIFEADTSPHARSQGGTLDLHPGTGQEAIKKTGLWDQFISKARPEGEAFTICDNQLNIAAKHTHDPSKSVDKPEIDRSALRDMLLASIPADRIHWGKKFTRITDADHDQKTCHFEDGTSFTADLVVGADGGWSHVRSYLSDAKPLWTGAAYYSFRFHGDNPALYDLVNRGSVFSMSYGQQITAQYMSDGSLQVYAFFQPDSENWIREYGHDAGNLAQFYKSWAPLLRSAYEGAELTFARNLYMLPVGFRWEHRPGVTLIGDAAHLFTPFAGEGVNCGMADALELAAAIGEGGDRVRAYEEGKFARTRVVQLLTWQNTVDSLSHAHLSTFGMGLGKRLMMGVPDQKTVFDEKVQNEAMKKIHEQNSRL